MASGRAWRHRLGIKNSRHYRAEPASRRRQPRPATRQIPALIPERALTTLPAGLEGCAVQGNVKQCAHHPGAFVPRAELRAGSLYCVYSAFSTGLPAWRYRSNCGHSP